MKKVSKIFGKIIVVFLLLFTIWGFLSWADVLITHGSSWNLFVITLNARK